MYEYENNYLSFDSPGKVAEFNAYNRSIYDVYGHDNYIYKRWGEVEKCMEQQESTHWHTLSKSSNTQSEQRYPAFTRNKLLFSRNITEALDMNYTHWVNFLSAADNVSIESDSMNIHTEFLATCHMDIPNWHFFKMMPVHGACAPIRLTALVQLCRLTTLSLTNSGGQYTSSMCPSQSSS